MARKKGFRIPGVSFSWKRALGITRAKSAIARATGIPTTAQGRARKFGLLGILRMVSRGSRSHAPPVAYAPAAGPDSGASGCAGCIVVMGLSVAGMFAVCGGLAFLGSFGDSASPRFDRQASQQSVATWKAQNFQDESIDIGNRSARTQQSRKILIESVFGSYSPPVNGVASAELLPVARDGWYSDDVARKNFAGMVYAYYFGDNFGRVAIFDDGKQVGAYFWDNGPHYSDVSLTEDPVVVSPLRPGESGEFSNIGEVGAGFVPTLNEPLASSTPDPAVTADAEPEVTKPQPMTRVWTSAGGNFRVEAEFLFFANGKLKLRKADGSDITVDLDKLSDADKAWVEDYKRSKR